MMRILLALLLCNVCYSATVEDIIKKHTLDINNENDRCELIYQILEKCYYRECKDIKISETAINKYDNNEYESDDAFVFIFNTKDKQMIGFYSSVAHNLELSNEELVDNKIWKYKFHNNELYYNINNDIESPDVILQNCKVLKYADRVLINNINHRRH